MKGRNSIHSSILYDELERRFDGKINRYVSITGLFRVEDPYKFLRISAAIPRISYRSFNRMK